MASRASRPRRRRIRPTRIPWLLVTVATLVFGVPLADADSPRTDPTRPSVLFVCATRGHDCQLRTWDDWLDAGFEIALEPIERVSSLARLRRFNVVVVNFLPDANAQGRVSDAQEAFERALGGFLEAGGGAVVFAGGGNWGRMSPALDHLLRPYGARVPDEQVIDPDNVVARVGAGARKLAVASTTAIARMPATRGVDRIGYLAETVRADAIKTTQPIVLEEPSAWQVVARAERSAITVTGATDGTTRPRPGAATARGGPPILAAAREVGDGRLFLFPHNVAPTVASPDMFDAYLWHRDDRQASRGAQNRTLIMQAVRWAAEPSIRSGTLGGHRSNPSDHPDRRFMLAPGRKIDWARAPSGAQLVAPFGAFRGLIGATSRIGGGARSVAELSATAKTLGLSFLAFTEPLEQMDARKWTRLKEECRQASDADFLAIPGIAAADRVGNRYFAIGWGGFPEPPAITADGSAIDSLYRFWATAFRNRFVGVTDVGRNPNAWFEMKQVSAFAVRTARGRDLDDAVDEFLKSAYDMENHLPVAFAAVENAADIALAARGPVNVFAGARLEDLEHYIAGTGAYADKQLFWETLHPWYVSDGPILSWMGGIQLGAMGIDEESENTFRFGFRIDGLVGGDEILLMDGPTIHRHWRATGSSFTTEHTWPHEQTRAFAVRAIRDGETILLSSPATLQWSRRFNQAADRQNTIPYNYEPDADGSYFVTGVPIGPKYKGWPPTSILYGSFRHPVGAVGLEYTPQQSISWDNAPKLPLKGIASRERVELASHQHQALSCPGILIVEETTDRRYPSGERHARDSAPPKPTQPLDRFAMTQRRYGLYGAVGQLNGQLVESRIRALRDLALKGRSPLARVSALLNVAPQPGMSAEVALAGTVARHPVDGRTPVRRQEPMKPGDYIGVYPYGLPGGGAQYAVSGDLIASVQLGASAGLRGDVSVAVPARWKSGEEVAYSILYTTGASEPDRSRSDYRSAATFLGFDGSYPAIESVEGGTLLSRPVIATIETRPDAVLRLRTRSTPDAPLALPVRIRGYNRDWQVVYTLDESDRWRYMGELDGDFYFHLDPRSRAHTVVAGHPLLADRRELRIELDDPFGRQAAFELHNPTGRSMTVQLRTNPAFLPEKRFDVVVPPHASRRIRIDD